MWVYKIADSREGEGKWNSERRMHGLAWTANKYQINGTAARNLDVLISGI